MCVCVTFAVLEQVTRMHGADIFGTDLIESAEVLIYQNETC